MPNNIELIIRDLDISTPSELIIDAEAAAPVDVTHTHMHTGALHAVICGRSVRAVLYPYRGSLRYYFPDPNEYYYLPSEGRIIPRILAESIPRDRRQKAPRELCYADVSGDFLPIPLRPNELLYDNRRYRREYRSKRNYVKIEIASLSLDWLSHYLSDVLSEAVYSFS